MARSARLRLVPITLRQANAFVAELHRHHKPARGCVCVVGVEWWGTLCGVAVIGRPSAPALQDGYTAEVTRVCTDGTRNACSILYGSAWRTVRALGYGRLITYTLPEEGGASLRASGAELVDESAGGGTWNRPNIGRVREDHAPTCKKFRWEWKTVEYVEWRSGKA